MVERTPLLVVRRVPARKRAPTPEASLASQVASGSSSADPTLWSATIRGEPTAQMRSHDVVVRDGAARLVTSRPARLWQNLAVPQLLNRRPVRPLAHDLVLNCGFWSSSRRPPVDEGLVIEVLERAAIIAHGRQIREKHIFAAVDRDDPRVTVSLARADDARLHDARPLDARPLDARRIDAHRIDAHRIDAHRIDAHSGEKTI